MGATTGTRYAYPSGISSITVSCVLLFCVSICCIPIVFIVCMTNHTSMMNFVCPFTKNLMVMNGDH